MGFLQCCQGSHICTGANVESHTTKLGLCLLMCSNSTKYWKYISLLGVRVEGEGQKRIFNYINFNNILNETLD